MSVKQVKRQVRHALKNVLLRHIGLTFMPSFHAERRKILDEKNIDLVIDVGSNFGQFVEEIRVGYNGKIISFEPIRELYEVLVDKSIVDPEWKVVNLALGEESSEKTITVFADTAFSSFREANGFFRDRFNYALETVRREVVQMARFDEIYEKLDLVDGEKRRLFLKLDTQGYDLSVFRGLGPKIDLIQSLQTELSLIPVYENMPHWTVAMAAYEAAGFQVVSLSPVTRVGRRIVEYDCLMVRAE